MSEDTTNTSLYCKLVGFPKNVSRSQAQAYLPLWATLIGGSIHDMIQYKNSASAIIVFSTHQNMKTFQKLHKFVDAHPWGRDKRTIFIERYYPSKETTSTTTANDKKKKSKAKKATKNEASTDEASNMRKKKNKATKNESSTEDASNVNKKKNKTEYDKLAESFLKYVHQHGAQICHRDKVTIWFEEFYTVSKPMAQRRRSEAMVLARMRQKRLLKSKRYDHHHVVMTFCNLGEPGTFPSPREQVESRGLLLEQQLQAEEDKEGIRISRLPERVTAAIGQDKTIAFDFDLDEEEIVLEDVEIRGPHAHAFTLTSRHSFPTTVTRLTTIEWTFKPTRIGILRARAHFVFEGCFITRPIAISCGHAEMQNVLQITSPYQRKRGNYYQKQYDQSKKMIGPPTMERRGDNPFQQLGQYSIPTTVIDMITCNEYETSLNASGWSALSSTMDSIEGYGDYWKHLLWASEHRNWLDIQLFDLENAELKKEGRYYLLTVPGLAEGRPSVLRGDLVDVTLPSRQLCKGRVIDTKQLQVVLEFSRKFSSSFDPSLDRVHVRFTFSRMTFRTSHRACGELAEKKLGECMLVPSPLHVDSSRNKGNVPTPAVNWANRKLNAEQEEAIQRILIGAMRPLPYIIFGPPGTGKTTTVVETVYQLGKGGKNVLLVAPSNDAADILVERLASYFPPSELRRILAYSRSLQSLPTTIRSYANELLDAEAQKREILSARIVVSTVNLAARFSYLGVSRGHFDVLCVDEAGHATEPEVIAVVASLIDVSGDVPGQIILAGDPKQLGPITTSDLCLRYGLSVSYMERLTNRQVYSKQENGEYPVELLTKLVRNYRSHPSIIKLPNEMFYDNELQCCGDVMVTSNMAKWEHLPVPGFPVVFHALTGENLREGNSPSWFNPEEAQQVVEYVNLLMKETRPPVSEEDIGIITPYARQAQKIRKALATQDVHNIKVGSVECFQGQERRVIILSTVRAEQEHVKSDLRYNLGFVASPKRFNVAVTRAKTLLIVIGCPSVLAMDQEHWLPFLKYCHENKSWAGEEEWDPSQVEEEELEQKEAESVEDDWDLVNAPSETAEQTGFAFISREE